jgi:CubicO group peptidase (beta-lactamase class C family)
MIHPPRNFLTRHLITLLGSASLLTPGTSPALEESKLHAIRPAMEEAVAAQQAAGIVTLVMEKGKVVHHEAVGSADLHRGRAMQKDALFWIASMTKSINGTAVQILVEEGKLSLDEPASRWLPELGKMKLRDGSVPTQPITLRMLLSHTAGIAIPARKPTDGAMSPKAYVASLLALPLAFAPGSSYEYGFGPTVAGRILELVSGMKYEDFLQKRIFDPLGMRDTTFAPNEAQRARIAQTYKRDDESGKLVPAYNPFVTADASVHHRVEPSGGLFSTAQDMGRFYAMIAGGGALDGVRILSEKSVEDMTRPVTAGEKQQSYASGWQVNVENQRPSAMMPVGSFGHGGAYATHGWVDPAHGIVTVYLVQNVLVPDSNKPKDAFQKLVMESAGVQVTAPPAKKSK